MGNRRLFVSPRSLIVFAITLAVFAWPHSTEATDNAPRTSVVAAPSSVSGACVVAPADLTAWWPFDESSGAVASDEWSGLDATETGAGAVWHPFGDPNAGIVRGAIEFTGVAGGIFAVPDAPELDFGAADSFTIAAWVKDMGSQLGVIVDKRVPGGPNPPPAQGYMLSMRAPFHWFQLSIYSGGGQQYTVTPINSLTPGTWQHIAVTVQRQASGPNLAQFYIDGAPVYSPPLTGSTLGDLSTDGPLTIGGTSQGAGLATGYVDELMIFRRALSAAEIAAIHGAGAAGLCPKDGDGDGVPDAEDVCPLEDATGLDANGDGCLDAFADYVDVLSDLGVPYEEPVKENIWRSFSRAAWWWWKIENHKFPPESIPGVQGSIGNQLQHVIQSADLYRDKDWLTAQQADVIIAYARNLLSLLPG